MLFASLICCSSASYLDWTARVAWLYLKSLFFPESSAVNSCAAATLSCSPSTRNRISISAMVSPPARPPLRPRVTAPAGRQQRERENQAWDEPGRAWRQRGNVRIDDIVKSKVLI